MAEVKNAFIASKMNKDLDARLVPSGEYRNAINAQISRSEGADVGALENVLGNQLKVDFSLLASLPSGTLKTIGTYVDEINNFIYVFLTNHTGSTYSATAKNYIFRYDVLSGNSVKLVEGAFLNFSTQNKIYGINVLEDFLFFTDNRNQPRKINTVIAAGYGNPYDSEDTISVAKINPYQPIQLYQKITSSIASGFATPSTGRGVDSYQTTMQNVSDEKLPDDTNNPYYDPNFVGDTELLDDKFIRFSYRFKFKDGEYSLLAPFTQVAFIPKQDGYFLYDTGDNLNDMNDALQSTVVQFMENKVDKIQLIIPMPLNEVGASLTTGTISSSLDIDEIDIIYKESGNLSIQLVDTITSDQLTGNSTFYNYSYNSTKPWKTLPPSELTRVYDKVPVKALAQEVTSNRIVYGNYQNKHTSPESLDYNLAATFKSAFAVNTGANEVTNTTSIVEYPNSTLKQNRNYQVGFVLADRYGRSSSVILSNADNNIQSGGVNYGGSTLYLPYRDASLQTETFPGDSLKVILNSSIGPADPNPSTNWPGIYNGDKTSSEYNPLGWYSYKIVVKQTEQDYYNVYLPGVIAGQPKTSEDNGNENENTLSHTVLLNDNINKVPRDLTEVGPQQKQFRSSARLFPRVINTDKVPTNNAAAPQYTIGEGNKQFQATQKGLTVSTISNLRDLFDYDPVNPPVPDQFPQFYLYDSNPLIARLSTESKLGELASFVTPVASNKSYESGSAIFGPYFENAGSLCDAQGTISDLVSYYVASSGTAFITSIQGLSGNYTATNPFKANWVGGPTNVIVDGWRLDCTLTGAATNPVGTAPKNWISFDKSIQVDVGKRVDIVGQYNNINPGIQQLSVMETDPVDSLIDIYYETTSAGLITDINNVTATDTGAATALSGFTPVGFNEGIALNASVFNASNGVKALNAANQVIPTADTTPSGSNTVVFAMTSVMNNESTPANVTSYFSNWTGNQATGFTVTINQDFLNNVWYGSNVGQRTFIFNFTVSVNGFNNSTAFSRTIDLENINPILCPNGNAIDVNLSVSASQITNIVAKNGASPCVANGNLNSGRDITWSVISAVGANGNSYVNRFSIASTATNLQSTATLSRNMGGGFITQNYTITARASDPGGSTDQVVNVTMGNTPQYVKDHVLTLKLADESQGDDFECTIISINDSTTANNGWYIFDYEWDTLNNSNPILLDRTNACTGNCSQFSGEWFFSSTSQSDALDLWEASKPSGEYMGSTTTTVNIGSNYQFAIV